MRSGPEVELDTSSDVKLDACVIMTEVEAFLEQIPAPVLIRHPHFGVKPRRDQQLA
jgi:hypothetical protein